VARTRRPGGLFKPGRGVALRSRAKGTLGKLAPAGTGTFNPAQFLGAALPKLFGLFDLSEVLEALGIDKMPAFVTETLGAVQVETPDPALNVLANGWLVSQTLACRLSARSGYYQAGDRFGVRGQLQDLMAVVHVQPGRGPALVQLRRWRTY